MADSADDIIELTIVSCDGQSLLVTVQRGSSVAKLREHVSQEIGLLLVQIQLLLGEQLLGDDATLCDVLPPGCASAQLQVVIGLPPLPGMKVDPELSILEWCLQAPIACTICSGMDLTVVCWHCDGSGTNSNLQLLEMACSEFISGAHAPSMDSSWDNAEEMVTWFAERLGSMGIHTFRDLEEALREIPTQQLRNWWLDNARSFCLGEADHHMTVAERIGHNHLRGLLGMKFKALPGTCAIEALRCEKVHNANWDDLCFQWQFIPQIGLVRVVTTDRTQSEVVPEVHEIEPTHANRDGLFLVGVTSPTPPASCVDPEDYLECLGSGSDNETATATWTRTNPHVTNAREAHRSQLRRSMSSPSKYLRLVFCCEGDERPADRKPPPLTEQLIDAHLRLLAGVEASIDKCAVSLGLPTFRDGVRVNVSTHQSLRFYVQNAVNAFRGTRDKLAAKFVLLQAKAGSIKLANDVATSLEQEGVSRIHSVRTDYLPLQDWPPEAVIFILLRNTAFEHDADECADAAMVWYWTGYANVRCNTLQEAATIFVRNHDCGGKMDLHDDKPGQYEAGENLFLYEGRFIHLENVHEDEDSMRSVERVPHTAILDVLEIKRVVNVSGLSVIYGRVWRPQEGWIVIVRNGKRFVHPRGRSRWNMRVEFVHP
eukprot:TRINITY_DN28325_c0_g1_i1.p1 TRINITY_DN28325_c0_g1~~TRINITY_DN28325_c0_g1_i1.p1  ORF type:complete len:656 (-),score=92.03 TRINITY_DN28325_c0_g1_i1:63-2030(-)